MSVCPGGVNPGDPELADALPTLGARMLSATVSPACLAVSGSPTPLISKEGISEAAT